jgi:hypothetical protein
MNNPSENGRNEFAERRGVIQTQILACMRTAELCFGLRPASLHVNLDSLTGALEYPFDESHITTISRTYKIPIPVEEIEMSMTEAEHQEIVTERNEKIEATITVGKDWNPCVTFTHGDGKPLVFVFAKDRNHTQPDPAEQLTQAIVEALRGIKG